MPPTAKQYKAKSPKSSSDVSANETAESPKKDKVISGQLQRSMRKKRKTPKGPFKSTRGVVFVKNLPHGFFEEQLQKYFQQFGKVTRVRLARSLKTGGSKGFAFVEFAVPEVAEIAAETMNNYLMFRKIVKAAYIPPDEQKFNYFKTSLRKVQNKHGKEMHVSAATKRTAKKVNEMNNWSAENYSKRMKKTQAKLKALKRDLSHLGYDADSVMTKIDNTSPSKDSNTENGDIAPANKKQKRSKSTSEESHQNSNTDSSPAKSPASTASEKSTKEQPKIKLPIRPNAIGTLRRLLDSTIEDNSSSDDDFVPNETLEGADNDSSEDEDSEQIALENGSNSKKLQNGKGSSLKSLIDDTIEDEDSSDDDFEPDDNLSIDDSEEDDEESDDDEEEEDDDTDEENSSPSKPAKNFRKDTQLKLDKIGQKKLNGGIRKKSKVQKPARSLALKQKIQESAKEMVKQNKGTQLKAKNLKKGKKRGL